MSSLASCWRIPSQINCVLWGFRRRRLDDIQDPRASMVRLIALTVTRASEAEQCFRPGHRLHKADRTWLGMLRGMQYQKCTSYIAEGPGQTFGGDRRRPGPRRNWTATWTTDMERSLRKEVSQERKVTETRCNKISWSTASSAALTS